MNVCLKSSVLQWVAPMGTDLNTVALQANGHGLVVACAK